MKKAIALKDNSPIVFTKKRIKKSIPPLLPIPPAPPPNVPCKNLLVQGMQTVNFAFGPADGRAQIVLERDVPIPRGVTEVFASIQGFTFAFGVLEFPSPTTSTDYKWHRADHHFGLAEAYVEVVTVMSDKVRLKMGMLLRDENGDDAWTGIIKIGLLFLGAKC